MCWAKAHGLIIGKVGRSMLRPYKDQVQMKFPNFLHRGVK
jgi:hypothetical protein